MGLFCKKIGNLGEMMTIFFFFRYLTWFEVFLTNLELTHPGVTDLIDKGVIGAAHSMIHGSLSAVDRTMEETFMKFAEGSGRFQQVLPHGISL